MSGPHLRPVILRPVIGIFSIFRVCLPHFPRFPCFRAADFPETPVFRVDGEKIRIFRVFHVLALKYGKSDRLALCRLGLGAMELGSTFRIRV